MGHERIGALPRTKPWSQVVAALNEYSDGSNNVHGIAGQTIRNVRQRLRYIENDTGVIATYQFLIGLSAASNSLSPAKYLGQIGIELPENPSPLRLASAIYKWIDTKADSLEYAQLARESAVDAITAWHSSHRSTQAGLFDTSDQPYEIWRKAGDAGGFSELSRLFFAKFTERYLNYFIERVASGEIRDLERRDRLQSDVARHAFETSKITQSFAAGWFNNHVAKAQTAMSLPSDSEIRGFLSIAFGKIRDELIRVEASE